MAGPSSCVRIPRIWFIDSFTVDSLNIGPAQSVSAETAIFNSGSIVEWIRE
jgi:hypothetical protein